MLKRSASLPGLDKPSLLSRAMYDVTQMLTLATVDIVINMVVTCFSQYCAEPFVIEPVKIISPHNNASRITPNIAPRTMEVGVDYLNACCGLSESPASIAKLLNKMAYTSRPSNDENMLTVSVPPTRADVLHACDVVSSQHLPSRARGVTHSIPHVLGGDSG